MVILAPIAATAIIALVAAATTVLASEVAATILPVEAASAVVMALEAAAIRTLKALMRPIVAGLALRRATIATKAGVLAAAAAIIVMMTVSHFIVASRSIPSGIAPPGALPLPRIVASLLAKSHATLSFYRGLVADSHLLSLTVRRQIRDGQEGRRARNRPCMRREVSRVLAL